MLLRFHSRRQGINSIGISMERKVKNIIVKIIEAFLLITSTYAIVPNDAARHSSKNGAKAI
jgi:hypothetical protein